MKTIGLIGGLSWESSAIYYKLINEMTKQINGGFSSSKCLLNSVDFAEIQPLQHSNNWTKLDEHMVTAAKQLEKGGADFVLLCTNTMHMCADAIQVALNIPFLHIAEATGKAIKNEGLKKVALMGTKFTMEKDFYKKTLSNAFGIETVIPSFDERTIIHQIIYDELVLGKMLESSKEKLLAIIESLVIQGAEGIILGCTELPLLVQQSDTHHPIFNTMELHAAQAVHMALE